ncbi:MAG: secondary thiamine-phosphate synthase enzyme YjbQ [Patescibacteria group bacterium]|nr:secondary thiamine-phosphate synthase enzyme YjbQ [Patescibacteria group bacterium]
MAELVIKTTKEKEVVDITDKINDFLAKEKVDDGLVNIFLTHTTAALATADLDPGTDLDMLDAFEELIPSHQSQARYGAGYINYRHPHNPAHVPDHILSSLIGTSLTIPIKDGEMILGTWQRVVLIELDGPRERQIICSLI